MHDNFAYTMSDNERVEPMTKRESDGSNASTRRIAARHVFETRIRVFLKQGDEYLALGGWSRDLSESGLGAFVAGDLVPGESVTVEIPLTGSHKEVIPASVASRAGTRYGFQFTALSAEQRELIRAAFDGQPIIPMPKPAEE